MTTRTAYEEKQIELPAKNLYVANAFLEAWEVRDKAWGAWQDLKGETDKAANMQIDKLTRMIRSLEWNATELSTQKGKHIESLKDVVVKLADLQTDLIAGDYGANQVQSIIKSLTAEIDKLADDSQKEKTDD